MSDRSIYCVKLNKQAKGLDEPPYPGEKGQKIFDNISEEAWELWLQQQTMLINEYRLVLIEPEARKFLTQAMMAFLFDNEKITPPGFNSPQS